MYGCYVEVVFHFVAKVILFLCFFWFDIYPYILFHFLNVFYYSIEYINDTWVVKHAWNYEQLMDNKNEIQKSLIHRIVDDRLQEGTLVTDLIGLIKSPYTTPQQLVSKPVINIVLINYCINCFRRCRR